MSRRKVKITDRMLAMLLSIMMVVTLLPATVFPVMASTEEETGSFTFTVTDSEDNMIFLEGANITLTSDDEKWSEDITRTTDANGVVSFPIESMENALTDGSGTVEFRAEVSGYYTVIGVVPLSELRLEMNTPIIMKKIAEESAEIVVKDSVEDSELKGAEILLKLKKDDEELLKLLAVTNAEGIAKFDKEIISQVITNKGSIAIEYTVSSVGYQNKTASVENITSMETLTEKIGDIRLDKMPVDMFDITVQDGTSNPISGVEIAISAADESWELNLKETTGQSGTVSFSKSYMEQVLAEKGLGAGTIKYIARHDDYFTKEGEISFNSLTELLEQTVIMKRVEDNNSFQICVKDENGNAVEGAEVTLTAKETGEWTLNLYAISGSTGIANFDKQEIENALSGKNPPNGNIVYKIDIAGYESASGEASTDNLDEVPEINILVESFKVTVKKESDNQPIADAIVKLSSKEDDEWNLIGETVSNGIVRFDKNAIAEAINGGKITSGTVVYTVYLGGEEIATGEAPVSLDDLVKNVDVVIATNTVSVEVTGSAAVKLNESDDLDIEVNHLADKVGKVSLEIDPDEGSYIKEVVVSKIVDGNEENTLLQLGINKGDAYKGEIDVEDNITIKVVVVREYKVNVNTDWTIGIITIDEVALNEDTNSILIDENTSKKLRIAVMQDKPYAISSIKIDDEEHNIFANDKEVELDINVVDKDVDVVVEYVRLYTVTVTHNANEQIGTVNTTPIITDGGSVSVQSGENFSVTATPKPNYRVSKVTVNNEEDLTVTGINDSGYTGNFTISSDYTIEITFSLNQYEVTKQEVGNGQIVFNNDDKLDKVVVDHNNSCHGSITPADGYMIYSIEINGVTFTDVTQNQGATEFTLNEITENKVIRVEFVEIPAIELDKGDIESFLDYTGLVRTEETENEIRLIYAKGTTVRFFAKDSYGIKLLNENNQTISKKYKDNFWDSITPTIEIITSPDYKIYTIQTTGLMSSNNYKLEKPLKIIIDASPVKFSVLDEDKIYNNYYNNDFEIGIDATDNDSGIKEIEYFITDTKINDLKDQYNAVYEYLTITQGKNINKEILFQYQSGDSKTYSEKILVDVEEQKNNSDFVSVWFKITDRAGNVTYDRTDYFKVNCTPPKLTSVDVSGESHLEAQAGYYYKDVTVTVKFADRASSFNKSNDCFTITENGQVIEIDGNSVIINWTENGDELIATIKFVKDAKYSLAINYTNAANKAMVIAEGVSSNHLFTVDKNAPKGTITFDEDTIWEEILETLTFGFFSDKEVTATATVSDDTSETYDILYYMSDTTTLLTEGELEAIYDADNSSFTDEKITVSTKGKYIIYARLTDYAGNTSYISTEGTIIEDTDSEITVIPSEAANGNGFYNKDVILNVTVKDKLEDTDDLYSGIKTIDYYVVKDGVESELTNLYTFNKKSPKYEELKTDWTGNITIKANEYNSDNVKVVVVAEDNAGNKKINDECTLKINVDEVKATLTMDGVANKVIDEHGYFKVDKRTATITVIDRLSAFDSSIATDAVNITAVDNNGNEISNAYEISAWESKDGKHTATVTFNTNAIYTWSFDYTNKADNALLANNFDIEDVQTPFSFTIDNVAPNGVVKVNDNAWDKLLNVLTFGYYDKVKAEVSAEASDNISPFIIEYYKTSNVNPMTESELEDVEFKPYAPFSVSGNEQFVVYVKISDYAGNCTYISSAGHVIDEAKSTITLTQSQTDALYNASDDVKVNVLVEDAEPYSGIKLVEYWIVNNGVKTQGEVIYTFDETNPTYDKLMKTWTGVITVDKSKNNSNDIEVYVRTVDNANNEETKSTKLAIDTVKPSISVKFDNGNDNNGNTYFDDKRVATVVITERAEQFDKVAATKGILVNAVDAEGNKVNDAYTIGDWTTSVNVENPDASTHTATITFAKDANYTWSISYTDKAGNTNSAVTTSVVNGTSVAAFDFTVDTVAPTGTLQAVSAEGKKAEWNALRPNLTFGFVSKGKITVSGTFDDVTSASAYKIEYYKVKATAAKDGTTALTEKDLNAVKNWTSLITKQQTNEFGKYYSFGDVVASKDEQFVVYVKLTDLAGNVKYLSTNGLIVDHTAPSEETLAPEVTMTQKAPVNGVYKDDVSVEIKVVDPLIGGTYSGLESVTYKVLNMGKETQTGELFAFKIQDPKQSELAQTWTGKIVVNSELNNSNNVQVVVYATDKAGNQSSKTLALKIDTTAPVIDIEYNNNNGETSYAGETLFKEDRVATIKVTERNFNGSKVVINVTNTDGSMPALSNWTVFKNGTGNGDDTVYMATLTYSTDGDYKFDIKYTDEAENVCTDIDYGQSLAPTEFTIDKTLPTIQVSYDNNNVSNGNYYNQDRTATVTVTEHNFDPSRYVLTITATDNGVVTQIPTAGQWTSNGDVHRMTIPFTKDAHYTIDIEFTDKAGNMASDFVAQNFFIDKTNPTLSISGVTNESANNAGEVGLVITATDTNMDVFEPDIYAVIVTDDSYDTEHFNIGKRQNITNGIKYTVSNLEKDGMYKVECNVVDKAGNVYSEVLLYKSDDTSYTEQKTVGDVLLTFSVNREGSVYDVNDVTEQLIKDTYVQSISDDLAIVEVNADELVEYQVILNGKALTEDVDFTVVKEGGNGQWYKYTYLVNKSLFEADGEYELVISSKDKAFNSAFSDVKGRTITFVIDTTEPVVAVSGLESNGRYKVTEQTVTLVPTDDGGYISKVLVGYADKSGNIYQEIFSLSGEELRKALEEGQGKLSFVIKEGLDKDIKIMCWDSAFDSEGNANVYEKIYTGVSVSTSQMAMLWASDAIRNAIIISVAVVVVGITAIIVIRKTRKKKSK